MGSSRGGLQPRGAEEATEGVTGVTVYLMGHEAVGGWRLAVPPVSPALSVLLLPQVAVWDPPLGVPTAASWVTLCEEVALGCSPPQPLAAAPSLGEQGPGTPSPEVAPAVVPQRGLRGHEDLPVWGVAVPDGRLLASRQHGASSHSRRGVSCAFEEPLHLLGTFAPRPGSAPRTAGLCALMACTCICTHTG